MSVLSDWRWIHGLPDRPVDRPDFAVGTMIPRGGVWYGRHGSAQEEAPQMNEDDRTRLGGGPGGSSGGYPPSGGQGGYGAPPPQQGGYGQPPPRPGGGYGAPPPG